MVLQDTWLKAGAIRDNIKIGPRGRDRRRGNRRGQGHTNAHSFIKRLPEGYDTVITEDGGSLSQGQKQLLCITRVMLCLPPMLILDEATSSIDTRTEQHIQRAFEKLMTGRTSFIVAHRLSTIQTRGRDSGDEPGRRDRAGHARGTARPAEVSTRGCTAASLSSNRARLTPLRNSVILRTPAICPKEGTCDD